jgi:hypothetical protein
LFESGLDNFECAKEKKLMERELIRKAYRWAPGGRVEWRLKWRWTLEMVWESCKRKLRIEHPRWRIVMCYI